MDILYGIQGTGNGHISRAGAIIPHLLAKANVDVLISGYSTDVKPGFPVLYRVSGIGYTFGKSGGIDYLSSAKKMKPFSFIKDIRQLPVEKYDTVISDFEPVTSWACRLKKKPCLAMSHQAAFLSEKTPRPPKRSFFGETILKKYAPATHYTGFHFEAYDKHILTPIIRDDIRNATATDEGHITVYLPAYDHYYLMHIFKSVQRPVHLFSKTCKKTAQYGNVNIHPVNAQHYLKSLSSCSLLVCGAGFEAPSEGLYLGKKMICIPMKGQYEQHCNAAALQKLGVNILMKADYRLVDSINRSLELSEPVPIHFPDIMQQVLSSITTMPRSA